MTQPFSEVYREHVAPIWRYVRTRLPSDADADDLTADVFAAAMRSWERFDPDRGSVGGWLVGIARHRIADWWTTRSREVPVESVESAAPEAVSESDDPESMALRRDDVDTVRRHLGALSPREREAVALRFGTSMTSEQIGAAMGITPTAARMLVYRGVGKLREVMSR
ncbi:sigma-70 family RNA polymerase sigma factor [Gordonia sp. ABSL1-1]|uniref:RNA polymerase sigma factor n=1 Tax=Gordonia sp. ABSL1-1 TaxID=3053923 RepID=UPI0025744797|nr:sigma-70 family RNA polymerase sigma factor [Gordonia sp. ABSL1-1]MDL9936471.1 sigma-70 family RNA polymerase sigma factor [Gordonia sp. ABSL1-1]